MNSEIKTWDREGRRIESGSIYRALLAAELPTERGEFRIVESATFAFYGTQDGVRVEGETNAEGNLAVRVGGRGWGDGVMVYWMGKLRPREHPSATWPWPRNKRTGQRGL